MMRGPKKQEFRRSPGLILLVAALMTSSAPASGGLSPTQPRCEYAVNPLGIDVHRPRLSWVLQSDRRAETQTAYQVLAAGSLEALKEDRADLWDSGKVESEQTAHVAYGGKPLASGARVHWKVRVWDRDGQPSAYSEPAWWEMGLLQPSDWSAQWIAADPSDALGAGLRLGAWIWCPQGTERTPIALFRRSIDLGPSANISSAVIKLNADNGFELYVNGAFVANNSFWDMPRVYDITPDLASNKNTVAVKVVNSVDPGGLRVALRIRFADGRTIELASDESWLVSAAPQPGWNRTCFDDSEWSPAVVLPPGGAERWNRIRDPFGPQRSVCLRKTFHLDHPVSRARAYVSGLGLYELHVNGRRVGEDAFTPGWTDYDKRTQYQTYDATPLLHEGENAVGAILGNGWFSGDLGWAQKPPFSQGPLKFLLQLDVQYEDGTRDRIITDPAWRTHASPIVTDTFYHGETCDARLEQPGWSAPGFDAAGWFPAIHVEHKSRLVARQCEPMRVAQELKAVRITEPEPGVHILDFGQNAAGWVRLNVSGPRGTRVLLRFAELLKPDDHLDRDNLRSAKATDCYILKGQGRETWEPRFTYHGFRYCEVTGYPGVLTKESVVFRIVHSAVEPAGRFECSNPLLNRVWRNVTWSQRSNMYSVWTDCPQRDERLGWTGDAVAIAPTACWNMQMARFLTKWMRDLSDGQAADGGVPDIAPNIFGSGAGAPGWSDAITILPWTVYQFYGDKRVIEENYPVMSRWVEFMRKKSENHLYARGGYGDWVAPVNSPKEPIAAAYYYRSTDLLARMARAIGRTDDAERYTQLARRIAEAFNRAYFDEKTHRYQGATQTANVLPLYFGLVPPEQTEAVVGNLVRDIAARDHHLSTGFVGTAYLMPTLTRYGKHEVAYRLASQKTPPSWGYMVEQGATTVWELWDADRKGPEMNSRNHAALGAVGRWFFEALAGVNIDPSEPAFEHIIIRPKPAGELTWAGAEYQSIRGLLVSRWSIDDNQLTLNVMIPAGSRATVYVPAGPSSQVLESGRPAESAEGVHFLRREEGTAVYEVDSGSYEFTTGLP